MSLISCHVRQFSRKRPPRRFQSLQWGRTSLRLASPARRYFSDGGFSLAIEQELAQNEVLRGRVDKKNWDEYKASFHIPEPSSPPILELQRCIPSSLIGTRVTVLGFLGKVKNMSAGMSFVNIESGSGPDQIQILARTEFSDEARQMLRQIKPNSAVSLTGALHWKYEAKDWVNDELPDEGTEFIRNLEMRLVSIKVLNTFSRPFHQGSMADPKERDMHIRFDKGLRQRLKFRSEVAAFARRELADFQEVETPILFKSTPEGAREFLVPTRKKGFAYGLPQSPQQYKQILMASGINRYIQFAKCFRDEDHRADRQPEFTQIDLEMAWANGEQVMQRVEQFVKALWRAFTGRGTLQHLLPDTPFIRMTYDDAMSKHGSDKPDLRIPGEILRIDHIVPADLSSMLTSIESPIIDTFKIKLNCDSKMSQKFIRDFMDSSDAEPFSQNIDGAPGIFVFDHRRPLEGLQAFGFEGAESLKTLFAETNKFDDGDLLLVQARPNLPHSGGSTMIGKLRSAIYKAALMRKLIEPDNAHYFLWVTDFPMFTLDSSTDVGQGGFSGFSATHHPFTAPKTSDDLDLLLTNPLEAKADHYDLVLNGVELGGGSRRIHSAAIQRFIMKDILKIPQNRMDDFKHLFRALEAGCPPHAGLAIGFDRLIAIMHGRDSVRDVIAFPKSSNGEDAMVESPSALHWKQLEPYHLKVEQHKLAPPDSAWIQPKGPKLDDQKYLNDYLDHLRALPNTKSQPKIKSFTPVEKDHFQNYIEHIQASSPKVQDQSSIAVMIDDSNDLRSYAAAITNPSLKTVRLHPGMVMDGIVQLPELSGMVGESILVASKLEKKTTAQAKGSKTIWGGLAESKGKQKERKSDSGDSADTARPR